MTKNVTPMREIKREHVVTQSLDFSCGAAGLSTILKYYLNDPVSEQEIIETLLQSVPLEKIIARRGFSLLDLKTFAKSKGYEVNGYRMDLKYLKKLGKPVLVPIKFKNYHHFVIVRGVMGNRVFIADPAAGNMTVQANAFNNLWIDGVGLVIEKEGMDSNSENALKIQENDFLVADYKSMRRLISPQVIRTAIFPGEF